MAIPVRYVRESNTEIVVLMHRRGGANKGARRHGEQGVLNKPGPLRIDTCKSGVRGSRGPMRYYRATRSYSDSLSAKNEATILAIFIKYCSTTSSESW